VDKRIFSRALALLVTSAALSGGAVAAPVQEPASVIFAGTRFYAVAPADESKKTWLDRVLPTSQPPFTIMELVPAGQLLDNWKELLTVEEFEKPASVSTSQFGQQLIDIATREHPPTTAGMDRVLGEADSAALSLDSFRSTGECALIMLRTTGKKLWVVQYSRRRQMNVQEKAKLFDELAAAHLENLITQSGR
jgi:hypothetical protein